MNRHQTKATRSNRAGLTIAELLVAGVLLMAGISLVSKLAVSTGSLFDTDAQYRLALSELEDQLAELTVLPESEVRRRLPLIQLSDDAAKRLKEANLSGEVLQDALGTRIKMQLEWTRHYGPATVELAGWISEAGAGRVHSDPAGSQSAERESDVPSSSEDDG